MGNISSNKLLAAARSVAASLLLAALLVPCPAGPSAAAGPADPPAADEPDYNLVDEEDDSPVESKLKAALRLFSAYNQVQDIAKQCGRPQLMQGYNQANGSTLADVIKVIRTAGGQSDKWKDVVVEDAKTKVRQQLKVVGCDRLLADIGKGDWALYSKRFTDDYKTVKGR